jgi:hypothetical protein
MPDNEYINVDLPAELAPNTPVILFFWQVILMLFKASMFS